MQFQPDLNKSICSTPATRQLSAIKVLKKKKKKKIRSSSCLALSVFNTKFTTSELKSK